MIIFLPVPESDDLRQGEQSASVFLDGLEELQPKIETLMQPKSVQDDEARRDTASQINAARNEVRNLAKSVMLLQGVERTKAFNQLVEARKTIKRLNLADDNAKVKERLPYGISSPLRRQSSSSSMSTAKEFPRSIRSHSYTNGEKDLTCSRYDGSIHDFASEESSVSAGIDDISVIAVANWNPTPSARKKTTAATLARHGRSPSWVLEPEILRRDPKTHASSSQSRKMIDGYLKVVRWRESLYDSSAITPQGI
ncbi:hypothetical protein SISSUDRAFT_394222 [Sistotremastrum suecicum HHB10207 ss-3]|uniref:Uncharacterized protein n=1 Tax=Sistotremastrum suecicum HHB10207 ss-3 TaxID=1314776 RepID=A0A165YW13_9AGAM|nr:hypothetical protein SISSUDRAFT_394222 [Sistotremastrum suecicum HHB10207 ss-3]